MSEDEQIADQQRLLRLEAEDEERRAHQLVVRGFIKIGSGIVTLIGGLTIFDHYTLISCIVVGCLVILIGVLNIIQAFRGE